MTTPDDDTRRDATEPGSGDDRAVNGPDTSGGEPIPRLPRGKGISLSGPQLVRIAMFAALLVAVLFLRRPCADGIASFMGQFDPQAADAGVRSSEGAQTTGDDTASPPAGEGEEASTSGTGYIRLRGDMSEDEIKQALEQAGLEVEDPDASQDPGDGALRGDAGPD